MDSMKSVPEQDKNCLLQIRDCGIGDYRQILQLQQHLRSKRHQNEIPNTVLVVEHPAVITLGARQSSNRLLVKWIGERKIASIGVRVSKFITYHGMAININNDLSIFDYIVPCGLDNVEMTSVLKETGKEHPMNRIKQKLAELLKEHFPPGEK
jgi:lipoate-protein ligase B